MAHKRAVSKSPQPEEEVFDPYSLLHQLKDYPSFEFIWKEISGKRRLIGRPNYAMTQLHELFAECITKKVHAMGKEGKCLINIPSATGCVRESNHIINAQDHACGEFFYITDFAHAYPSVDLDRLTLLLVFIIKYDYYKIDYSLSMFARNELAHFALSQDPLYKHMRSFVALAFAGIHGQGLAVGGNLSPALLNVYCEVFLDSRLRGLFQKWEDKQHPERTITYTRYVDDLAFSRGIVFGDDTRREIRRYIEDAGFSINHKKSRVLSRSMGTVFVTKTGLRRGEAKTEYTQKQAVLVFSQKKRRRLHGIIQSYLASPFQNDEPEVVRGIIAEFIYYLKRVATPTTTDEKTLGLCKEFQKVSDVYRKRYRGKRIPR